MLACVRLCAVHTHTRAFQRLQLQTPNPADCPQQFVPANVDALRLLGALSSELPERVERSKQHFRWAGARTVLRVVGRASGGKSMLVLQLPERMERSKAALQEAGLGGSAGSCPAPPCLPISTTTILPLTSCRTLHALPGTPRQSTPTTLTWLRPWGSCSAAATRAVRV